MIAMTEQQKLTYEEMKTIDSYIRAKTRANGIEAEICVLSDDNFKGDCFQIEAHIEMGDWKWDHLRFDAVAQEAMRFKGYALAYKEPEACDYEDGSDCYSSYHTLHFKKIA